MKVIAFTKRSLALYVAEGRQGALSSGRVHTTAVASLEAERMSVGDGATIARTCSESVSRIYSHWKYSRQTNGLGESKRA